MTSHFELLSLFWLCFQDKITSEPNSEPVSQSTTFTLNVSEISNITDKKPRFKPSHKLSKCCSEMDICYDQCDKLGDWRDSAYQICEDNCVTQYSTCCPELTRR